MAWGSGSDVDTSKQVDSSSLYDDNGISVKQYTTVTTVEKRGMTKAIAIAAAAVTDNSTAQSYNRVINGEIVTIQVRSGSIVRAVANRANEADGWTLTTTTTTYTSSDLTGWTAAGGTTVTYGNATKEKDSAILISGFGETQYQYVETTEQQAKSVNEATALAACGVTDTTVQTLYYKVLNGDLQTITAMTGTKTRVSAIREQNGLWTLTKTVATYTHSTLTNWKTAFTNNDGTQVTTSKQIASSILFAKSGSTTIYQVETEEVTEYRGCNGTGATGKVVFSDSTSTTQYWAQIDGEVYSIAPVSGTRTTWSAQLNGNGVWTATKRVTTYSTNPTPIPSPWGTTKLDQNGIAATLTASGTAHNTGSEKNFSYEWAVGTDVLLTSVLREDSIVEYISSKANADAVVAANTSNTILYKNVGHWLYTFLVPVYVWRCIPVGVIKTASSSYNGPEKGWSVNVSQTTYGYTGTGWSENPQPPSA